VKAVGGCERTGWTNRSPRFQLLMNDYAVLGEEIIAPVAALGEYRRSCHQRRAQRSGAIPDGVWGVDRDCAYGKRRFRGIRPCRAVGMRDADLRKLSAISIATTRKSIRKLNCFLWVGLIDRH